MSDAVAVFRPKDFERLKPFLDLDDDSDESEGLYAEVLDDGAVLVHTFQPYELFRENPGALAEWLTQFGEALPDVHEDARGMFLFPDSMEPGAAAYEEVINEVSRAGQGVFMPVSGEEIEQLAALANQLGAGIDLNALQGLASQLLGGGGSFEIGKMMTDLNEKLIGAIGAAAAANDEPDTDKKPTPPEKK